MFQKIHSQNACKQKYLFHEEVQNEGWWVYKNKSILWAGYKNNFLTKDVFVKACVQLSIAAYIPNYILRGEYIVLIYLFLKGVWKIKIYRKYYHEHSKIPKMYPIWHFISFNVFLQKPIIFKTFCKCFVKFHQWANG